MPSRSALTSATLPYTPTHSIRVVVAYTWPIIALQLTALCTPEFRERPAPCKLRHTRASVTDAWPHGVALVSDRSPIANREELLSMLESPSLTDLQGPAGQLEARFDQATEQRGIAVLCHPHPQYGGNMHDAVLATAAGAMLDAGLSCLRFNYRGVGRSAGNHDAGKGEVDDVLAAMAAARALQGGGPLWLLGYSFGAAMAWGAAQRQPGEGLILIAPPVGLMDFEGALPAGIQLHVLHGDCDDFAAVASVEGWACALQPPASVHVLDGADHFFRGQDRVLSEAITTLLAKP